MANALISVIIPTYKRYPDMVDRAARSVINQTYQNIEIIVVDDSPENFDGRYQIERLLLSYNDKRIKYIKHPKNLGACVARNTGIKNSQGRYIAFLDDDDEWLPDKLELQKRIFSESKDCQLGIVYCGSRTYIEEKNGSSLIKNNIPSVDKAEIKTLLPRRNIIGSTSFPLIKRECFNKIGLFDEELPAKQDYDVWLRISRYFTIDYVPEVLCNYYAHMYERITNNIEKKIEAEKKFLKKHIAVIKSDKIALSIKNSIIGQYHMELGEFKMARNHLKKSIFIYPYEYRTYALYALAALKIRPSIARKVRKKLMGK